MDKKVYGQNGIGQNGTEKMLQNMIRRKWYRQNGLDLSLFR